MAAPGRLRLIAPLANESVRPDAAGGGEGVRHIRFGRTARVEATAEEVQR